MEGKNGLGGECGRLGNECGEPGDEKNDWRDERVGLGNECGEPGDKKNVIKLCCKEPENEVGFHLRPNVNDGARYIKNIYFIQPPFAPQPRMPSWFRELAHEGEGLSFQ